VTGVDLDQWHTTPIKLMKSMEKIVETAEQAGKLMFQVTLQADPEVVKKYYRQAKTGMLGPDPGS
jgi:hypothetical protein